MEELKRKVNTVYNWTVEDGKPQPPKQDLPQVVKDRADYFWEMAEDGMTFMGAMECKAKTLSVSAIISIILLYHKGDRE